MSGEAKVKEPIEETNKAPESGYQLADKAKSELR